MFDDRSHEVYPVVGEVKQHQIWAERARRIHRGPADRARPELGEDDVGPHPERRDRPEVLRPRGRAQDRNHQAGRQDKLHNQRLQVVDARTWLSGAEHTSLAEHGSQQQAGQDESY